MLGLPAVFSDKGRQQNNVLFNLGVKTNWTIGFAVGQFMWKKCRFVINDNFWITVLCIVRNHFYSW